jgi:hypothetical protein
MFSFADMDNKQEFLERELAWVRMVRKTTKPDQLHLVEPAVEREREILAALGEIQTPPPAAATQQQEAA